MFTPGCGRKNEQISCPISHFCNQPSNAGFQLEANRKPFNLINLLRIQLRIMMGSNKGRLDKIQIVESSVHQSRVHEKLLVFLKHDVYCNHVVELVRAH